MSQLRLIVYTLLCMTGRITMLGISRWAGKCGSYRTMQRFFQKEMDWLLINWTLIKTLFKEDEKDVFLIAGDTTTVSKSGKSTYGIGRFFSSLCSRKISGIGFQTLSLISVNRRASFPILTEQMAPPPKVPKKKKRVQTKKKQKVGRPLGSKNKDLRNIELNTELIQIQQMLRRVLDVMKETTKLAFFVYDGAFGNNAAVQMTRQVGLHLISKIRNNAALCFQYTGSQKPRGRKKYYGSRIDYSNMNDKYLISTEITKKFCTKIYQCKAVHAKFADPLNIVIILKKDLKSEKEARIILFSSDLKRDGNKIVEYYRLRFQIEFNFRDAKQHWGLEDFMVITQRSILNFANLSLFMVNVSHLLLLYSGESSVLDLKSRYHCFYYVKHIFKLVTKTGYDIIIEPLLEQIPVPGRIHERKTAA